MVARRHLRLRVQKQWREKLEVIWQTPNSRLPFGSLNDSLTNFSDSRPPSGIFNLVTNGGLKKGLGLFTINKHLIVKAVENSDTLFPGTMVLGGIMSLFVLSLFSHPHSGISGNNRQGVSAVYISSKLKYNNQFQFDNNENYLLHYEVPPNRRSAFKMSEGRLIALWIGPGVGFKNKKNHSNNSSLYLDNVIICRMAGRFVILKSI
jgi:hypothetical protein